MKAQNREDHPMSLKQPDRKPSFEELMARSMEDPSAEPAFMAALLEATVYVHAPVKDRPGNLRLVSFPHPQTGVYLIPFFSDRGQAEESSSPSIRIIDMTGRQLFEITPGATLILNPNRRYCLFYPEEVALLLQGKALPPPMRVTDYEEFARPLEPMAHPPDWLIKALNGLFAGIPGVESAAIARRMPLDGNELDELVIVVVVSDADAERVGRAATVALKEACERAKTNLDVLTIRPDEGHSYDQLPQVYTRKASESSRTFPHLH
jgi:hypothetical protein